jgi:hypothetical protein
MPAYFDEAAVQITRGVLKTYEWQLPANARHAALLARRLIEYKASAVIDLYELKITERRQFVN